MLRNENQNYTSKQIPGWIATYTSPESVLLVLKGCTQVLEKLGFQISVERFEPLDILPYWRKQLHIHQHQPSMNIPGFSELIHDTIHDFSNTIRTNMSHSVRYRTYLDQGPPSGLKEYPKKSDDNLKGIEIPMGMYTKYASADKHSQQFDFFKSHVSKFRRSISERSGRDVSDIENPEYYI